MRARVKVAAISYTDGGGRYARLVRGQVVELTGAVKRVYEGNPQAFEVLDAQQEQPRMEQVQREAVQTTQPKRRRKRKRE